MTKKRGSGSVERKNSRRLRKQRNSIHSNSKKKRNGRTKVKDDQRNGKIYREMVDSDSDDNAIDDYISSIRGSRMESEASTDTDSFTESSGSDSDENMIKFESKKINDMISRKKKRKNALNADKEISTSFNSKFKGTKLYDETQDPLIWAQSLAGTQLNEYESHHKSYSYKTPKDSITISQRNNINNTENENTLFGMIKGGTLGGDPIVQNHDYDDSDSNWESESESKSEQNSESIINAKKNFKSNLYVSSETSEDVDDIDDSDNKNEGILDNDIFFIDNSGLTEAELKLYKKELKKGKKSTDIVLPDKEEYPNWSDINISEEENIEMNVKDKYNGLSKTQYKKVIKSQNRDKRAQKAEKILQLEYIDSQFISAVKELKPTKIKEPKKSKKSKNRTSIINDIAYVSNNVKLSKKEMKRLEKQMKRLKLKEYALNQMNSYNQYSNDRVTSYKKQQVITNINDDGFKLNPKKEERYIKALYDEKNPQVGTVDTLHNEFINFYDKNHQSLLDLKGGRGANSKKGYADRQVPVKMVRFLHIINRLIKNFVEDNRRQTHSLPGMNTQVRRWIIIIAKGYNVKSKTQGSNKSKILILTRTSTSYIPDDWNTIVEREILDFCASDIEDEKSNNKLNKAKLESGIMADLIESIADKDSNDNNLLLALPDSRKFKGKLRQIKSLERKLKKAKSLSPSNNIATDILSAGVLKNGKISNSFSVISDETVDDYQDEDEDKDGDEDSLAMRIINGEDLSSGSEEDDISTDDNSLDYNMDSDDSLNMNDNIILDLNSDEESNQLSDEFDDDLSDDDDDDDYYYEGAKRTEVYKVNKDYRKGTKGSKFVRQYRGGSIPMSMIDKQPNANLASLRNILIDQILQDRDRIKRRKQNNKEKKVKFGGRDHRSGVPMVGDTVGSNAKPLDDENKGHKLLRSLGWTPGESLGSKGKGIDTPIDAIIRSKRAGLGHM